MPCYYVPGRRVLSLNPAATVRTEETHGAIDHFDKANPDAFLSSTSHHIIHVDVF